MTDHVFQVEVTVDSDMGAARAQTALELGLLLMTEHEYGIDAQPVAYEIKACRWCVNAADPFFGVVGFVDSVWAHLPSLCDGRPCVVHAPSAHHMRSWPVVFRMDAMRTERTCEHGVGHPDPDDLAYRRSRDPEADSVHGCDGCCVPEGER